MSITFEARYTKKNGEATSHVFFNLFGISSMERVNGSMGLGLRHILWQCRRFRNNGVRCQRYGGIRFQVNGNPYFELVAISNVGGSGVIRAVWIKGSKTDWMSMSRNWGMNWQSGAYLNGQSLSFLVQTDDWKTVTFYDVAPFYWWFGGTYTTNWLNF
ncbi:Expansin-A3 [Carex littledalei]|uniref:Expansin n=1 Tax=Carex littledalei TaxID=544730 RepID=A0A833VGZ4_9POAL|nr:Expansin-A3 [Carex littledalei]